VLKGVIINNELGIVLFSRVYILLIFKGWSEIKLLYSEKGKKATVIPVLGCVEIEK